MICKSLAYVYPAISEVYKLVKTMSYPILVNYDKDMTRLPLFIDDTYSNVPCKSIILNEPNVRYIKESILDCKNENKVKKILYNNEKISHSSESIVSQLGLAHPYDSHSNNDASPVERTKRHSYSESGEDEDDSMEMNDDEDSDFQQSDDEEYVQRSSMVRRREERRHETTTRSSNDEPPKSQLKTMSIEPKEETRSTHETRLFVPTPFVPFSLPPSVTEFEAFNKANESFPQYVDINGCLILV